MTDSFIDKFVKLVASERFQPSCINCWHRKNGCPNLVLPAGKVKYWGFTSLGEIIISKQRNEHRKYWICKFYSLHTELLKNDT